jgi:patatin-like phospholipase/acyl hydrolase
MTSNEHPLRLLSFDGGGVRGLSSLIILKHIMYVLGTKLDLDVEQLRPCEHFDMIAGTSTGGIIAIMLGTLRMNVDECIEAYLALAPKIFPKKGFFLDNKLRRLIKGVRGTARFDATALEEEVKKLVARQLKQDPDVVFDQIQNPGKSCHVYVLRNIPIGRHLI